MKQPKILKQEEKFFASMSVVCKVFPYKIENEEHPLVDVYGNAEKQREMLLCKGGLGENSFGWVTIKATSKHDNPDHYQQVAEKFKIGDVIEVTGAIEERQANKKRNGVEWVEHNRTLKILKLEKVKVVDSKTPKKANCRVMGVIQWLDIDNNDLVINVSNFNAESVGDNADVDSNFVRKEKVIHTKLDDGEVGQWIKSNLVVGDVVMISGDHYNVVKKKEDGSFKEKVNCLMVGGVEGYRKQG
jgi:hypothetical protein